jgi:imidazolonepropionase-like amidohydrolase
VPLVLALLLVVAVSGRAADVLLRDARLVDGTGAPPRPDTDVLVRDGRIAAIGTDLAGSGVPVLDADGATVVPGLVDAHVHLGVTPGSVQRGDTPEVTHRLQGAHLRGYLACGVTTVLDTSILPEAAREIRSRLDAGEPGPRWLTLGPGITAPGGYVADVFVAPPTAEAAEAHLALVRDLGAVGVKVFVEAGFGPWPVWPVPEPAVRAAIVAGARRHRLPIFVHANREADKDVALDMGARAIVHTGFYDAVPSDAFVRRLAASGTYLMSTCAIAGLELLRVHPERLEDPLLRRVVPPLELWTARDPAAGRRLLDTQIGLAVPWLPRALRGAVGAVAMREAVLHARVRGCQAAVRRFWEAGVPVVAGSDAGNWPVVPWQFHGPTTLLELELLAGAGLPPDVVLAAATRVPARMLGLDAEIGTIEVGKRADMVVVRKDPLRHVRSLRTIRWTIRDGEARTPSGWLAAAHQ